MSAASTLDLGERIAHRLLTRLPLSLLVRWVVRIQASVHTKLLGGYLLVVLLFIAMGALSLQTIARMSRQSQLLHQAHERVDSSRQIEHALTMQTLRLTNVYSPPSLSYCPGEIKNHAESC